MLVHKAQTKHIFLIIVVVGTNCIYAIQIVNVTAFSGGKNNIYATKIVFEIIFVVGITVSSPKIKKISYDC